MDVYHPDRSSLSKLYRWKGLYENYVFGGDVEKRKQQVDYVEKLFRPYGVVYRKRGGFFPELYNRRYCKRLKRDAPIDISAVHFIQPIPFVQDYLRKPNVQERFVDLYHREEMLLNRDESVAIIPKIKTVIQFRKAPKPAEPVDLDYIMKNSSVYREYDLDISGAKTKTFYENNFPSLAKKVPHEKLHAPTKRQIAVKKDNDYLSARRKQISNRIKNLNGTLAELERQTSDTFLTVLRSEEFEPQKWPWNENVY